LSFTIVAIHQNEGRAWLTTDYGLGIVHGVTWGYMGWSGDFREEFEVADKWSSAISF